MVDLDEFKPVNDRCGHETGDQLLVQVADRLRAGLRPTDTVARWGGDEFALLLADLPSVERCEQVLERLRARLRQPYRIRERNFRVTASIGVSLYPTDGPDGEALLRCADQALYLAKHAGRDQVQFFDRDKERHRVARAFGRGVVAEGLETREQGMLLLDLGCEFAQGFYIAHPMEADSIPAWVETYTPPTQWASVPGARTSAEMALLLLEPRQQAWLEPFERGLRHPADARRQPRSLLNHPFARWLAAHENSGYASYAVIKALEPLDQTLHAAALALIRRHEQAEPCPPEMIDALREANDRLVQQLRALRQDTRAQTH